MYVYVYKYVDIHTSIERNNRVGTFMSGYLQSTFCQWDLPNLLHAKVVLSFLLLVVYSIIWRYHNLHTYSVGEHLVCFQVGLIMNISAMNILETLLGMPFREQKHEFLFCVYLVDKVGMFCCSKSWQFFKVAFIFKSPSAMYELSTCSILSPGVGIIRYLVLFLFLLNVGHSVGYVVVSQSSLNREYSGD